MLGQLWIPVIEQEQHREPMDHRTVRSAPAHGEAELLDRWDGVVEQCIGPVV